ncbi:MAG: OmpA family protein [Flavobacteriales bacterium]|jgi:peptidoglycan-associated lipoprotein|nr:OmpA family protein [Flavobacteriales bacterium]
MKILSLFTSLTVLLMLSQNSFAQKNFAKEADAAFKNENFYTATEKYKKAMAKAKPEEKARMNYQLGESYRFLLEAEQAEVYYGKAMKLKYDKTNPDVILKLANVQKQQANYKLAKKNYEKYLAVNASSKEAKEGVNSCKKAIEWISEPTKHVVQQEIQLNTNNFDFSPTWADKKYTQMVFSSSRNGATGDEIDLRTGESYMDLWITTRDNKGKWGEPVILDATINTEHNEGASILNAKGTNLYFTRCPVVKKENVGCDILVAVKSGKSFKNVTSLGLKGDAEGSDSITVGHPAINKRETLIIFASDMAGGQGGKDLWYSLYNKREKSWGTPVNLGPSINTPGDELFPYLDKDENLYFSSDGHIGLGGLDMFKAEKTAENKWGKIANLQYPLNSSADDYGILFEKNTDQKGFFTSNREGGKGKDDIYNFSLPEVKYLLEVYVKDKDTGEPIPGVTITLLGSDGSQVVKTTDEEGKFIFDEEGGNRFIKKSTNYGLQTKKDEYLAAKTKFSTEGEESSKRYIEEVFMQHAGKDDVIDFPEVQYAYNKSELLVNDATNAKDSLNYLYNTLTENPTIIIELQAHTDCRGKDAYNEALSQRRAQSCVDYLISKGIPAERMVAKGMGETIPRALGLECETIGKMATKEEQEAAHQRNRRTQFKVLSYDYKPTGGQ